MPYATRANLKAHINMQGTGDDAVLDALLDAATAAIDRFCNRPDGFEADASASARYYNGSGGPYQWIDECIAITAVAVKDSASDTDYTAWTTPTTDFAGDGDWLPFRGDPNDPVFNRLPYTGIMIDPNGDYSHFTSGKYTTRRGFRPLSNIERGVPTVRVTARWGYAATAPDSIEQACIVQAARWYKRGQSAWTDTLASAEMGQLMYRKPLDPAVQMLLVNGRYVRPAIGRR